MGLFGSKERRVAKHRALLDLSAEALKNLKIEAYKKEGEVTSPLWTDASRELVPLEYRWWISLHLDTLVCAVYDTAEDELGDRDWIRDLGESLSVARAVLAGLPEDVRQRFRGDTFARVQAQLDEQISYVARGLATDNGIVLIAMDDVLKSSLESARTALTWFADDAALAAAYALSKVHDKKLPRPSLYELRKLVEDGEVVLGKLRARSDR